VRRDKCAARSVGSKTTFVTRVASVTLWSMEPITPLIRELTQPLHRELARRESAPSSERDAGHIVVHALVLPLQRSYDGTAFSSDDDE
jgi:hypothetical protein